MDTTKDWLNLLELTKAWGEASRRNDTPLPTDHELWTWARSHRTLDLPKQVDIDQLDDLRDAFNHGRQPHRIDMDAVIAEVTRRGHPAKIDHTGGNTATIYAGTTHTDRNGDTQQAVAAGPGWFEAPNHRKPFADTSEFTIGPDDDGHGWSVSVPEHTTTAEVAALIVATIDEVETRRARLAAAAPAAAGAMVWAVAARYPELGTATPDPGSELIREVQNLIAEWLHDRLPALRTAPAHLADPANRIPPPPRSRHGERQELSREPEQPR
ncbi:hypothetical protein [Plantactinospora sp. CA-290183]|uniref:hypothetical protein n=1 Tax=Plantactinospora sp. CA-290183 TaxID=3240006 RepID=UPI003D8D9D3C